MVDPMYAKGGFHTGLGLFMLPLAFFLYWMIACLMTWVTSRMYEEVEVEEESAHV
jgi:hypothetical protein